MISQIRASAGAGKTYTLTQRFLACLQEANPQVLSSGCGFYEHATEVKRPFGLSEILAATFTNKAAAEMKARIITALKSRVLAAQENQKTSITTSALRHEQWLATIFRHYSALNIRTIDSLLNLLVKMSALELSLPPDFQPSFDPKEYYTPTYDGLMNDLTAPRRADAVFLTHDQTNLYQHLESACRSLIYYSGSKGYVHREKIHDTLLPLVTRLLEGKPLPETDMAFLFQHEATLYNAFRRECANLSTCLVTEKLSVNANLANFLGKIASLPAHEPPPASTMLSKETLDLCLNKASRGSASSQANALYERCKLSYTAYAESLPELRHAMQLAPLVPLAHEIHARLDVALRQSGVLPSVCIPSLAHTVLSGEHGVADALCRMGTQLMHIFLDEFQDTSKEQWAAIKPLVEECLAHGGSLTYVGDVKQAIYGWRGGEASLFNAILHEEELQAIVPAPTIEPPLPYNWRSSPAVISHNNAFFSLLSNTVITHDVLSVMLPKGTPKTYIDKAARSITEIYAEATQLLPPAASALSRPEGKVALYAVDGANTEAIDSLVHDRLKRLFAESLSCSYSYSDIAILVPTGGNARLVASWLTDWSIPVVTENSFLLGSHPLIRRLIAFLTFIDYPFNNIAFWEFVTGSECFGAISGLNKEELDTWAASLQPKRVQSTPLFQLFRSAYPKEWELFISPFYAQAGLMSAYDTLMEIIRHFSLFTVASKQAPFLQRLLEVAHLVEKKGMSSIASFLAHWEQAKKDEKLPLPETMDAVTVMTIHKAKGLEFPVVIVPFHHKGERRSPAVILSDIKGTPVLTKATPLQHEAYYNACITDEQERLNLLYVAWTRAATELHAFITRRESKSSPLSNGLSVLLDHYRQHHESLCTWEDITPENGQEIVHDFQEHSVLYDVAALADSPIFPVKAPESQQNKHTPQETHAHFAQEEQDTPSAPWRPMDWLPRLKVYRSSADGMEGTTLSPRQRGILTHLCLESLILTTPGSHKEDVDRAILSGLQRFPLFINNPDEILAGIRPGLVWFAQLPYAPSWLSNGLREQPIIDTDGSLSRVDLVVRHPEAIHAIDYKTGGADAPISPLAIRSYEQQVLRYMRLLAAAQPLPVYGQLVYLDEQRTVEVTP